MTNVTNLDYDPTKDGAIVAIRIYEVFDAAPRAVLAFAFGGTVDVDWADVSIRETYSIGINAYTFIYDERCAEYNRTFESFVKEKS